MLGAEPDSGLDHRALGITSEPFHIGIDLAWADTRNGKTNESGVVMLGPTGRVLEAGWCVGLAETVAWLEVHATEDVRLFVDAPLVVENATGQRLCERQVGQRYWRSPSKRARMAIIRMIAATALGTSSRAA